MYDRLLVGRRRSEQPAACASALRQVVSYFAELCVFATLREQNSSAVFTLRRQVAEFRKGEIKAPPCATFAFHRGSKVVD